MAGNGWDAADSGGNGGEKEKEREITPFVADSRGPPTFLLQPTPPLAPCGLGATFFFQKRALYYLIVIKLTPGLCITRMHTAHTQDVS
jgi:hypothetical protein